MEKSPKSLERKLKLSLEDFVVVVNVGGFKYKTKCKGITSYLFRQLIPRNSNHSHTVACYIQNSHV